MGIIDWIIVALFLGTLVTIGYLFSRKNKNIDDYFVAGRAMPGWLVALAATGTSISAGTFVGSPELGFNTNLTYVMNLIAAIIGGSIVAAFILPKLYNAKTITIYGFIGDRFGETSTSPLRPGRAKQVNIPMLRERSPRRILDMRLGTWEYPSSSAAARTFFRVSGATGPELFRTRLTVMVET